MTDAREMLDRAEAALRDADELATGEQPAGAAAKWREEAAQAQRLRED